MTNHNNLFYIYCYLNPLKPTTNYVFGYEPFYIGKGKGPRIFDHLKFAKTTSENSHKLNTIRRILSNNLEPIIIKLAENLSEDEAFNLEKEYISVFGRSDLNKGPLTNKTDGGEGSTNKVFSTEYRKKLSIARRKALSEGRGKASDKFKFSRKGKKDSKETNLKRSISLKNHYVSEETKLKISEKRYEYLSTLEDRSVLATMKGKKHTQEAKLKMSERVKIALSKPETKEKRSMANKGGNNPRAKKCEVFNIKFNCLSDAELFFSINKRKLKTEKTFRFL